jgi:anthranilate phosphoribosyltransferase
VVRNDELSVAQIEALSPERIVISPGPGTPDEAGVSVDVIRQLGARVPGVRGVPRPPEPRPGLRRRRGAREDDHARQDLAHPPRRARACSPDCRMATKRRATTRWWSRSDTLPECLEVTAWTDNDGRFDRRDHGPAASSRASGRRRAVPSRVDPDRAWACTAEELPRTIEIPSPVGGSTNSGRKRTPATEAAMPITPQEALQRTIEHREIFHDEMVDLMRQIMRGEVSPTMTAAILTGLRVKKETVGEIAGAATVLREFARPVQVADRTHLVDIVGTGGDGAQHVQHFPPRRCSWPRRRAPGWPSTAIAACRRSRAAADVLESLGAQHRAGARSRWRNASSDRHRLHVRAGAPSGDEGRRTRCAARWACAPSSTSSGPLTNPANAPNILMGVFHPDLVGIQVRVLQELGAQRALVVWGRDGMDELSLGAATLVGELRDGVVREYENASGRLRHRDGRLAQPARGRCGRIEGDCCWPRSTTGRDCRCEIVALQRGRGAVRGGRGRLDRRRHRQGARRPSRSGAARAKLERIHGHHAGTRRGQRMNTAFRQTPRTTVLRGDLLVAAQRRRRGRLCRGRRTHAGTGRAAAGLPRRGIGTRAPTASASP